MKTTKQEDFIEKLKEIYPTEWEKIVKTHYIEKPKTFRVNTLIASEEKIIGELKEKGFEILNGDIENSYCALNSEKRITQSDEFTNNLIYIQELSSMIPALALEPKEGEKILDLCAAPGSKTTQLAALTKNKSEIYAVEKSRDRFFKMKEIVGNNQAKNVKFFLEDGNNLIKKFPEFENYFDNILLDVPCSNEGSIDLTHPSSLKFWSKSEGKKISKLQKGLLNSAIKMLKPGGTLTYSTCTYSVEENELVVDWVLKRWQNLELRGINLKIKNSVTGITSWRDRVLNEDLKKTMRVLPNERYNGFFVAKIFKM